VISIEQRELRKIFEKFKQRNVLIVGDVMLDEYLIGSVQRISPEAPVPVVDVTDQEFRLGGAANVALNLQNLGLKPLLVGVIGADREGRLFSELVEQSGMNTSGLLQLSSRHTTVKTRIIGQAQHITRVDREAKEYLDDLEAQKLVDLIADKIEKSDGIILQDYNKGVLNELVIKSTIELAIKQDKLISVDPKFTNFLHYRNVTIFKPNIKETEAALAMHVEDEKSLLSAGERLLELLESKSLLITRGAEGMSLFEQDGAVTHIPTKARKIADVSGAGDTVISTLTASLIGGASHQQAATIANYAAGLVCEEIGIVPVNKEKLMQACCG
jgi:rfaE bifunctional protein kinase chain/domain